MAIWKVSHCLDLDIFNVISVHFGPKREIYGIHRQGRSFDIFGSDEHIQISLKGTS